MPPLSNVREAVASGDRREALIAIRDRLAHDIDNAETLPRDRAAIAKQLQSVLVELEAIPVEREEEELTPLEIARRSRAS